MNREVVSAGFFFELKNQAISLKLIFFIYLETEPPSPICCTNSLFTHVYMNTLQSLVVHRTRILLPRNVHPRLDSESSRLTSSELVSELSVR